jgi:amino acid adenylation domain-containing protein
VARARPAIAITEGVATRAWESGGHDISTLRIESVAPDDVPKPPLCVSGDDPSYVMFTSGSTGEPKAILGTHSGLSHFVHWEVREFSLGPDDRVAQLAPPTFDVSLRDIFVPLLAGGGLCVPTAETRGNIRSLLDWLDAEAITVMHCVPSLFRALIEEIGTRPAAVMPALRHVLLAGEPLYGRDVQRWRAVMGDRVELANLYGPSETTLAKAFHRIVDVPNEPARMIPVGLPLPNTALLILRDGELCDKGEIGEVFIRTPFMSKGYLNDPQSTQQAFVQNPLTPDTRDLIYRTGDVGRYRADRSVELLGRRDAQVKVNGVRIELGDVEQALLQHPSIRQAVVAEHAGADQQVFLCAYFIADTHLADESLREHMRQWLDVSMHPAFLVQMEAFPLNLHGKVNRRALPRPSELLYRERPCIAAEGEQEIAVAAIWSDILGVPKIGVTHSFVELGGDSLKAIRALSRIAQQSGLEVKLQELFPRGTVREIAAVIAARQASSTSVRQSEAASAIVLAIEPATAEELQWLEQ